MNDFTKEKMALAGWKRGRKKEEERKKERNKGVKQLLYWLKTPGEKKWKIRRNYND